MDCKTKRELQKAKQKIIDELGLPENDEQTRIMLAMFDLLKMPTLDYDNGRIKIGRPRAPDIGEAGGE